MSETDEQPGGPCGRILQELKAFKNGLSVGGGDLGSLGQLFFDNLSTLLGALFAIQSMQNFGVPRDLLDDVIFGRVVPGCGITLVIGNIYYSWQAIRLTNSCGRQYTAQPYGLNTVQAFSFIFNIIYSIYFASLGDGLNPSDAFMRGYKTAISANFITGLISVFLGCFGPLLLQAIPPAALLVPIAGIGFSFLGLEQLTTTFAAPIVGYSALIWVYLGWYAGVKIGWGKFQIPEAVTVILVGVILGWITGVSEPEDVEQASKLVKWSAPTWSADDLFQDFSDTGDYMGIIIPIAIASSSATLMCLVSAKEAGDPYPVRESLVVDGIGTCLASFFGCPFGTVIYVGHPAHKRSGATVGYSFYNGVLYLIFSLFGILALIQALVNQPTVGPIVFFVGLMINEEALEFMPSRHYSAYIIGLFPSIYDWLVNVSSRSPLESWTTEGESYNNQLAVGSNGFIGVLAWKRGSLLISMVWTAMLVMVLDRRWKGATLWATIASLFALFGIIHMPTAGFKTINDPIWEQCYGVGFNEEGVATDTVCWEFGEQWMFFMAYIILAVMFALIKVASKFSDRIQPPIDDPTQHAFDDWFKDAKKGAESTDGEGEEIDLDDEKMQDPTTRTARMDSVLADNTNAEEVPQVSKLEDDSISETSA